jgi:3-keto-disaccharide hydrolase
MRNLSSKLLFSSGLIIAAASSFSQTKNIQTADLRGMVERKEIEVFNRSLSLVKDDSRAGVHLDEKEGDGVAWLKGIQFSNGTLEFDVKGKDLQGQSFVGLAFHGLDNKTYDAIYLRPFNFKAEDKARKSHCVQYISHPLYTWNKLREESPGKYEQPIEPAPDPNSWVHVRVVVASPKISVFINDNGQPSLTVDKLSQRTNGSVGFWVGNGSGGDFANLKIIHSK